MYTYKYKAIYCVYIRKYRRKYAYTRHLFGRTPGNVDKAVYAKVVEMWIKQFMQKWWINVSFI